MNETEIGVLQGIKKDLDVVINFIKAGEERRLSKIADDHKFFSNSNSRLGR